MTWLHLLLRKLLRGRVENTSMGLTPSSPILIDDSTDHVRISSKSFDGFSSQPAIDIRGTHKTIVISDCYFSNGTHRAIKVGADLDDADQDKAVDVRIENCTVADCDYDAGILVFGRRVLIHGCSVKGHANGDPIYVKARQCTIANNFIANCTDVIQGAITVKGAYRGETSELANGYGVSVIGNHCFDIDGTGIFVAAGEAIVANNALEDVLTFGINLHERVGECVVSGNRLRGFTNTNGTCGIRVCDGGLHSICGNLILGMSGSTRHPIRLHGVDASRSKGVRISGNYTDEPQLVHYMGTTFTEVTEED